MKVAAQTEEYLKLFDSPGKKDHVQTQDSRIARSDPPPVQDDDVDMWWC